MSVLSKWSEEILSLLRIAASFMFIQHGTQKMFGFPVEGRGPYELMTLSPGLAGLLEVVQGRKGGYRLLKAPEEMTLLDVVEAVDGELFLNDCIMRPESCFRNPECTVYLVWKKARDQLRETLREASFDKLLKERSCMDSASELHRAAS